MKIPEDVLAALEDFWAEEYESDYVHVDIENSPEVSATNTLLLTNCL